MFSLQLFSCLMIFQYFPAQSYFPILCDYVSKQNKEEEEENENLLQRKILFPKIFPFMCFHFTLNFLQMIFIWFIFLFSFFSYFASLFATKATKLRSEKLKIFVQFSCRHFFNYLFSQYHGARKKISSRRNRKRRSEPIPSVNPMCTCFFSV